MAEYPILADDNTHRIAKLAAERGIDPNAHHLIEEMGETLVALEHLRRGRSDKEKVREEVCDVVLCALAVLYSLGDDNLNKDMMAKKAAKCESHILNPRPRTW